MGIYLIVKYFLNLIVMNIVINVDGKGIFIKFFFLEDFVVKIFEYIEFKLNFRFKILGSVVWI